MGQNNPLTILFLVTLCSPAANRSGWFLSSSLGKRCADRNMSRHYNSIRWPGVLAIWACLLSSLQPADRPPLPCFLQGFYTSLPCGEQVLFINPDEEIDALINAPAPQLLNPRRPVCLILYALPNGNSIEQTFGRTMTPDLDWHNDIQHIGAQTRWLRDRITDRNLVLILLQTRQKSWPAWKAAHSDHAQRTVALVDSLRRLFQPLDPRIVLSGHSGGGRFIFSFLDGCAEIPDFVERIVFLDSNYGYEARHAPRLLHWLGADSHRTLMTFAYNDSVALLQGKRVVSDTGGTWHRSHRMLRDFSQSISFTTSRDSAFQIHQGMDGRLRFYLKENPNRGIWHTEQVARNGFVHALLAATKGEEQGYAYWGHRIYTDKITPDAPLPIALALPGRPPQSPGGSAFAAKADTIAARAREEEIYAALSHGNLPDFLRHLALVRFRGADAAGDSHSCILAVTPDYLAIGSDADFLRIPMRPETAQRIAAAAGAVLPTPRMVDVIFHAAPVHVAPVPYFPQGDRNEQMRTFHQHQLDIQAQLHQAGAVPGQLTAGHKKDIVISRRMMEAGRRDHLQLYGWHRLDGTPIQPLTNVHVSRYVDYSHGVRLVHREVVIDGRRHEIETVLQDALLHPLLSDEAGPLPQTRYKTDF